VRRKITKKSELSLFEAATFSAFLYIPNLALKTLQNPHFQYNKHEIQMSFEQAEMIDLSVYEKSSIWDVIDVPAALVNTRTRIEYQVHIR
jgi:hypothetical protein